MSGDPLKILVPDQVWKKGKDDVFYDANRARNKRGGLAAALRRRVQGKALFGAKRGKKPFLARNAL